VRNETVKLSILKSVLLLLIGAAITAPAGIYTYSGSAYSIPDGSLAGVSSQVTVSGSLPTLTDLTVTLNISGGYNGDLYAYLSYDGHLLPLLNRIGVGSGHSFGSAGAGMNVTLADWGTIANGYHGNIHTAGDSVLSGTWQPDGQITSPTASASSFSASGGSITLDGTFGNLNPNGTWTLFFADAVTGGGRATLNGWSLDITAVPEPVNVALGIFAGVFVVVSICRTQRTRKLLRRAFPSFPSFD
jgi:hypothetical protein